jgi:ribosomal protein S18 acetylase RimI-like enzyme
MMEIRPATVQDLEDLLEIDGTVESSQYLHVDYSGEGTTRHWKLEPRSLRQKLIESNPLDDDRRFTLRQVLSGADEGLILLASHEDQAVAMMLAQPDYSVRTMRLVDLRVDYDLRRQGLATAMVFQLIQQSRDQEFRAIAAEARTNNYPANELLSKCGFELSGIDVRRISNEDLVKESATLFWYAELE